MGIPYFVGEWLQKNGKTALIKNLPLGVRISSLSLDFNGILHRAREKVYGTILITDDNEKVLFNQYCLTLVSMLANVISLYTPEDTLIIAVDGVAPMAKIRQQKQRREKSALNVRKSGLAGTFDGNNITPGTDFMIKVDEYLKNWLNRHIDVLPAQTIYSNHLDPGEGEHKIMNLYRSNTSMFQHEGIHVVYGLDADLVLLSTLSPLNRLYLVREDSPDMIDIDQFRVALVHMLGGDYIKDFVFMMSLAGNDFLPAAPACVHINSTVDWMVQNYLLLKKPLIAPNGGINWAHVVEFLRLLGNGEGAKLTTTVKQAGPFPFTTFNRATVGDQLDYAKARNLWYNKILSAHGGVEAVQQLLKIIVKSDPRYVDMKTISPLTTGRIGNMAIKYMEGMVWVYYYYNGYDYSKTWYYPYHYAPFLQDIGVISASVASGSVKLNVTSAADTVTFGVLEQLVAALPAASVKSVPDELRPLLTMAGPIADYYPLDFIIDMEGAVNAHMGIPLIPMISMNRIAEAVASRYMVNERKEIWDRQYPTLYQGTFSKSIQGIKDLAVTSKYTPVMDATIMTAAQSLIPTTGGRGRGGSSRGGGVSSRGGSYYSGGGGRGRGERPGITAGQNVVERQAAYNPYAAMIPSGLTQMQAVPQTQMQAAPQTQTAPGRDSRGRGGERGRGRGGRGRGQVQGYPPGPAPMGYTAAPIATGGFPTATAPTGGFPSAAPASGFPTATAPAGGFAGLYPAAAPAGGFASLYPAAATPVGGFPTATAPVGGFPTATPVGGFPTSGYPTAAPPGGFSRTPRR